MGMDRADFSPRPFRLITPSSPVAVSLILRKHCPYSSPPTAIAVTVGLYHHRRHKAVHQSLPPSIPCAPPYSLTFTDKIFQRCPQHLHPSFHKDLKCIKTPAWNGRPWQASWPRFFQNRNRSFSNRPRHKPFVIQQAR